jgi:hypothetical protein
MKPRRLVLARSGDYAEQRPDRESSRAGEEDVAVRLDSGRAEFAVGGFLKGPNVFHVLWCLGAQCKVKKPPKEFDFCRNLRIPDPSDIQDLRVCSVHAQVRRPA